VDDTERSHLTLPVCGRLLMTGWWAKSRRSSGNHRPQARHRGQQAANSAQNRSLLGDHASVVAIGSDAWILSDRRNARSVRMTRNAAGAGTVGGFMRIRRKRGAGKNAVTNRNRP
jgi:hypothetical protein